MTKDEKNKRVRFTFRIPEKLFSLLKIKANEQGLSINAFILHILWNWVDKEGKDELAR